ncbi:hypothetical protein J5N97_015880 [Dioscorea zingiberensis]|uniref:Uncharacterized protein n=1 Tax=Dioscorea zingiberensis TaxID=325984 RepID=A0A9D5CKX5_9LILI|nr:hypothetical protein J5N97_015880 [Dioscorea zingiberensis]
MAGYSKGGDRGSDRSRGRGRESFTPGSQRLSLNNTWVKDGVNSELVESYVGMTSSRGGRRGGSNAGRGGRGGRGDVPWDYAQYQSKEAQTGKIEYLNYKPDGQMVSHSKASTSRASPPPPSGSSDHMPVEASSLDGTAGLPLLTLRGPVMDDEEGSVRL